MSSLEILEQLRALPAEERRQVVNAILDEFPDADLTLTAEQAAELDRRLADHEANPEDVVSWDALKAATNANRLLKNP
jgi:putative addiction module component (TIGR02574 family)